uniref:Solute carrier family 22 member 3 n=1 Tax=Petromyzon marinus TaxID=7757 RepID=A0AAJ7SRJ6_PETMA|nr:solute carrier family 22 member 3-like isoform X1 [Petromyzon marinus]
MSFDALLRDVGEFGPYQKRVFIMLCLPCTVFSFQYLGVLFLGQVPRHRCKGPPETRQAASPDCGVSPAAAARGNWSETRAAAAAAATAHGFGWDLRCKRLNLTSWAAILNSSSSSSSSSCQLPALGLRGGWPPNGSLSDHLVPCDHGWEFNREDAESTIVTEFGLVCENAWLLDFAQALLNLGFLLGAIIMGYISDRFGRRWSFLISIVLQTVSGVLVSLAPNYATFVALRTLQGIFNMGSWTTGFVIVTEFVGSSQRKVVHMVMQMFFSFGVIIMPGIAYYLRTWRYLQLAFTLPNAIFITYYWLLPESPRWLLSRNRKKEVVAAFEKIARGNRRVLCSSFQKGFQAIIAPDMKSPTPSLMDLLRSPKIRKYTLVLMFYWFVVAVVYQGLALSTGNLGGNLYVAFLLGGVAEIPGALLVIALVDRIGRLPLMSVGPILSGLFCLASTLVPVEMEWLYVALVMLARLCMTMAYQMVCLLSNELYPTFLRNFAVSICSSLSGIGGIAAPFLLYRLYNIWKHLPLIIFGILAIAEGFLILLLPETKGLPLPETIQDAENIGKIQKAKRACRSNSHRDVIYSLGKAASNNMELECI